MKPMNAVALKGNKYHEIITNKRYIVEEKFKGIRALIHIGYEYNKITSRGGHYIEHRFPHIRDFHFPEKLHKWVLDCELCQEGIEDEVISGWGNHRTINIDPSITKDVRAKCFDLVVPAVTLENRRMVLHNVTKDLESSPVDVVPFTLIENAKEVYDEVLERGGEGIMLKNLDSYYVQGKRLNNIWYKLKGEETFDVVITGFQSAKQYSKKVNGEVTETKFWQEGLIGAFEYGMYTSNPYHSDKVAELVTLGTCSGMSDDIRRSMTRFPQAWLYKVVEIKGVEQKPSGAIDNPRYIRKRPDKEPEECIWER